MSVIFYFFTVNIIFIAKFGEFLLDVEDQRTFRGNIKRLGEVLEHVSVRIFVRLKEMPPGGEPNRDWTAGAIDKLDSLGRVFVI